MKYWIIVFLLLLAPVYALEVTDFVHDTADIISETGEATLRQELRQLQIDGIAEVSVVTINSLEGEAIEDYALRLGHGTLGDEEKDNGLLLLVSLEDREYRFEVGYGLEGALNDAKVGRVGRYYLVPKFKTGDYEGGILDAVAVVEGVLRGDEEIEQSLEGQDADAWVILLFITFFIIFSIIVYSVDRRGGHGGVIIFGPGGRSGGRSGGFGGGGFGGGGSSGGW